MTILAHDLPDDVNALKRMILEAKDEIETLKLQIAKLRRLRFGKSSEKVAAEIAQLELALDALEADRAERETQDGHKPAPGDAAHEGAGGKRKPARNLCRPICRARPCCMRGRAPARRAAGRCRSSAKT